MRLAGCRYGDCSQMNISAKQLTNTLDIRRLCVGERIRTFGYRYFYVCVPFGAPKIIAKTVLEGHAHVHMHTGDCIRIIACIISLLSWYFLQYEC